MSTENKTESAKKVETKKKKKNILINALVAVFSVMQVVSTVRTAGGKNNGSNQG